MECELNKTYLAIDIGNTRVKAAVFKENRIILLVFFRKDEIIKKLKTIVNKYNVLSAIVSSVDDLSEEELKKMKYLVHLKVLSEKTRIPFINLYETPKTLGADRVALTAAAVSKFPKRNTLIIDAGTCITFDFVNKKAEYLGGAISPGIELRYKALHSYTAKLPMLKITKIKNFIGNSTESSIHSGVINGIINEIEGVINQYQSKFKDLTVVLTGGNTIFLAKQLKNTIFANPNFVLEGLHSILIYNETNE